MQVKAGVASRHTGEVVNYSGIFFNVLVCFSGRALPKPRVLRISKLCTIQRSFKPRMCLLQISLIYNLIPLGRSYISVNTLSYISGREYAFSMNLKGSLANLGTQPTDHIQLARFDCSFCSTWSSLLARRTVFLLTYFQRRVVVMKYLLDLLAL